MPKVTKKSKKEIKLLHEGGKILADALNQVKVLAKEAVKKKVTTQELNDLAERIVRESGAEPSFLNYSNGSGKKFPATICTSINHEIVHGVPDLEKIIREGDLLKVDLGVKYKKLYTDAAITIPIGQVSKKAYKLMEVTQRSLEIGLEQIYPGSTTGNYGNAVEKYARKNGFEVVRGLVGHGVGYDVHEPPQIPNFGKPGDGVKLEEGMVLALEPMLGEGSGEISMSTSGFAFETIDKKLSAHFEHTVVVTKKGYEILTQ